MVLKRTFFCMFFCLFHSRGDALLGYFLLEHPETGKKILLYQDGDVPEARELFNIHAKAFIEALFKEKDCLANWSEKQEAFVEIILEKTPSENSLLPNKQTICYKHYLELTKNAEKAAPFVSLSSLDSDYVSDLIQNIFKHITMWLANDFKSDPQRKLIERSPKKYFKKSKCYTKFKKNLLASPSLSQVEYLKWLDNIMEEIIDLKLPEPARPILDSLEKEILNIKKIIFRKKSRFKKKEEQSIAKIILLLLEKTKPGKNGLILNYKSLQKIFLASIDITIREIFLIHRIIQLQKEIIICICNTSPANEVANLFMRMGYEKKDSFHIQKKTIANSKPFYVFPPDTNFFNLPIAKIMEF